MKHLLPELKYSFDALEPWIDSKTMEIHYGKHHQGYADKMNAILEKYPELSDKNPIELMKGLEGLSMDEKDKLGFKNSGGGYINHSLFWEVMGPKKGINKPLADEIASVFGSIGEFKNKFSDLAVSHFGSGWAWLVRNKSGVLEIYSTQNQDSPLLKGDEPLMCLDVWEHAYYLKYQNRRAEYVQNWWNVLRII
jgi:Fe-Mn family superoxide dismutase